MKKFTTKDLCLLGLLAALIILMAVVPSIGYIKIGVISISLLMIPVAIGALSDVGIAGAALLGTVFGFTSFVQCFGMDAFGTFLFNLNPVFTFLMCVAARALAGAAAGVVSKATKKLGVAGYAITGISAALANTALFMGMLLVFFWGNDKFIGQMNEWGITTENIGVFFMAFVGFNFIFEAIASGIVTCAVGLGLKRAKLMDYAQA